MSGSVTRVSWDTVRWLVRDRQIHTPAPQEQPIICWWRYSMLCLIFTQVFYILENSTNHQVVGCSSQAVGCPLHLSCGNGSSLWDMNLAIPYSWREPNRSFSGEILLCPLKIMKGLRVCSSVEQEELLKLQKYLRQKDCFPPHCLLPPFPCRWLELLCFNIECISLCLARNYICLYFCSCSYSILAWRKAPTLFLFPYHYFFLIPRMKLRSHQCHRSEDAMGI